MFRWNDAAMLRAIDLACVESLTVDEVADLVGCSRKGMFNFYRDNRSKIDEARISTQVSDPILVDVLDMWGDGATQAEIASHIGIDGNTVRRLILIAELDEQPEDMGAGLELLALQMAHPDRFYEDYDASPNMAMAA
jgi:hypothetical protein